jgi:hypothetical protein
MLNNFMLKKNNKKKNKKKGKEKTKHAEKNTININFVRLFDMLISLFPNLFIYEFIFFLSLRYARLAVGQDANDDQALLLLVWAVTRSKSTKNLFESLALIRR